ncbi:hypothetical protein AKJ09_05193 [Labilithrix luteola]|uniref:Uncharacterized protein n=1 Tax=Labilithrix luteola TaxID=1391654 RepID=A0A0K1PZE7_9BACT|nr:hypothetical protein [Labilithrix luteola]AKU98529.1 hypothetical protein AKJ09_05193 [Labilithrix luteola]
MTREIQQQASTSGSASEQVHTHSAATGPSDTATDIRHRIERSLRTRLAPKGTVAAKVESALKRRGARAWSAMKKRPSIGIVAAGGAGLALATAVGVGELAIAAATAYAAYQVLSEGLPPDIAVKETLNKIEEIG